MASPPLSRRNGVLLCLLLSLAFTSTSVQLLNAQQTRRVQQSASGRSITLQQLLERGLRLRRPEEFQFVRKVVQMVEQGKLSEKLVKSTYNWARKKRPYPYPYFERGLKLRAAKEGIRIP